MKWYTYLICFVLIIIGAFCGIQLYREIKAESYINGSIDISNQFSQETFSYTSTSVVFYGDGDDNYSFETDLLKVDNFNGEKKQYQLKLNDYILLVDDEDIKAGSIYAVIDIDYYNTDGELAHSSKMNISIKFLSNKTQLTLSTTGADNVSYLEQYFADNGIRLRVLEIL